MPNFTTITVQQAAEKLNSGHTLLLDIRDKLSFNRGHVAQSALLNDHNLPQFLLQHDYDTPMMVLCYHGISSRGAAQYLINQGFEEVYSVDGGFEAWERSYPEHIERSAVE